ncbi:MAG: dipeptide epimerase [Bacteroidia bacterium]
MKIRFTPHWLEFKYPFTLSVGSRTRTPIVITEIEHENCIGFGEASMPPYLGETHESVISFLQKASPLIEKNSDDFNIEKIMQEIDALAKNNTAAKASIDIALHDLLGKIKKQSCHEMLDINVEKMPLTFFTLGMDEPKVLEQKIKEAEDWKILKIKLGSANDKQRIEFIRSITDKPIAIDVNQGWKDKIFVHEMLCWLHEKNILFVEQAMPKEMKDEMKWLKEKSPIILFGDESIQRLSDVNEAAQMFHGINIKLMKCTGMSEALKIIVRARELNLKIMIGCMSETSCANAAAAQLAPLTDWADLDGPALIKNDFFEGFEIKNGKILLNNLPGIGVLLKK